MDKLDKKILAELQNDFPLSARPYHIIAHRLRIDIEQLWDRINGLLDSSVIRRIGASLDSKKLGFCSTLAAVSVEPEVAEHASEIISRFAEVTHSYLRRDDFNIWFTIIAPSRDRIDEIIEQIRSSLSLPEAQILNLPANRLFKLNARFTPR